MASRNQRANKPESNQKTRDKSNAGQLTGPPKITVPWGRSASEYRPGLSIKDYLERHGEVCAAEIYHSLKEKIKALNEERVWIGDTPLRRPNYSSFSRYFHWFLILGLIQRTDKRQPSKYSFLQKRVFYRLTDKGKREKRAWEDPLVAVHPELR